MNQVDEDEVLRYHTNQLKRLHHPSLFTLQFPLPLSTDPHILESCLKSLWITYCFSHYLS